jgi:hypothetical protein
MRLGYQKFCARWVMSEVYLNTLKELCRAIQNKGLGVMMSAVVLLNYSVYLNIATCTQALLEHFNRGLFDHPPYNPDLPPSNYHLSAYLNNWLRSQCGVDGRRQNMDEFTIKRVL